jgi:outer membrane cobalamin receptor
MGYTRTTLFLTLGLALGATEAAVEAEGARKIRETEVGDTVTVTAEVIAVPLIKTPNPVKVVDKAALERIEPVSVADVIKTLYPGQVLSNGGVGTATSFFLGGARSQDVAVTINGIRALDPMGLSGIDLNILNMAGIDRVEVQQGACSARQGASALGGVLALSSGGPSEEGFSGLVSAAAGTKAIRRSSVSTAYGWSSGWIRVAGGASQEEQVIETTNPYRTTGSSLSFGQEFGDDTLVTAQYLNAYSATPTPFGSTSYSTLPRSSSSFNPNRENRRRFELMSTSLRSVLSDTLLAELRVGGFEQARLEPNYTTGLPTEHYDSRGSQASLLLSWTPNDRYGLSETTSYSTEWGTSPSGTLSNTGSAQHLAVNIDGFAEITKKLRFTASLRQQTDRMILSPAGSLADHDRSLSASTGKIGLNWLPTETVRLYVSAANSYAHPTLFQLLYNMQNSGPALGNEKGKTVQAGANWTKDGWKTRLDLSRTSFSRMVFYDPTLGVSMPWGMSGAYDNGQDIRIQSAELGIGYSEKTWMIEGFYRNQEARDLSVAEPQQLSSNTVVRRPFQSLGLSGSWTLGDLRLDGRWSWFGARYEYSLPFAYKNHFNDLNLSATYSITKSASLTLRGSHLLQAPVSREQWLSRTSDFENDREMIYGYPSQTRTVTLECKYRF